VRSRVEGFKAGGLDYIQKPYSAEELVARVGIHIKTKVSMEEMKKKNYELEVRERLRRDMTDMIVHDLKAPVTSIQATLDIIKSQGLLSDADSEKLINVSQTTTGMMLIMINDLLDVARSEVDSIRTSKAPVDIVDLVDKVKNLFDPACGHRQLTFKVSMRAAERMVFTDHQLLFRILCNLSVNALKFSPHGGEILLECERQGSVLRLMVSDRGPGVPDALKSKIFEKGVSFGTDKDPNDRSTGIGLAFCALAAQALGGKIWVEDRQGGGSRFLIEFPNVQIPAGQKIKA
jgi:signal transduction histidine kinase